MMNADWLRRTALMLALVHSFAVATPVAGTVWPQPAPPRPVQPDGPPPPALLQPNFLAPSAEHCAGPVETRERAEGQPMRPPSPMARDGSERLRVAAAPRGDREASAEGVARSAAGSTVESSTKRAAAADASGAPPMPGAAPMSAPATAAPAVAPPAPAVQSLPAPRPADEPAQRGSVTAGMVDDNAAFSDYLAFRRRHSVPHRHRDVRERYRLEVNDARGEPVPDAEVAVRAASGATLWLRTDAGGQAWIHPDSFDPTRARFYDVSVRQGERRAAGVLRRGQQSSVELTLAGPAVARPARLDLLFLVDATGSMGDEIDALKRNLRSIVDEVSRLPSKPDLCLGLVAYRDRGDAFMVRTHDLTNDVGAFQGVLDALRADGGGDYPEAMNEAFNEAVHRIRWRGDGTTRLVVLLADAPPHLDYDGPQYDDDMLSALGKGIKVFAVGASGLDRQGEYIQRQIAQYTGGRFVFLTYAQAARPSSGPGRETVHDVRDYSVQTLDRLIVKLVTEELARRPRGG